MAGRGARTGRRGRLGRLQQGAHVQEGALQRAGERRGGRGLGRVEGRQAEDDAVGLGVVGGTVAVRNDRAVAHETVGRRRHLQEGQGEAADSHERFHLG